MLMEAFQNVVKLTVFSRQVVLKAVAEFVVCDDQVSVAARLCNGIHHNDLTRALQSQARSVPELPCGDVPRQFEGRSSHTS